MIKAAKLKQTKSTTKIKTNATITRPLKMGIKHRGQIRKKLNKDKRKEQRNNCVLMWGA